MMLFFKLLTIIASYFLGAIPSAYVFGKIFGHINIMEHGSGNVGTTNTFRILGWKIGSLVFIFDVAKGFLSAWIGYLAGGVALSILCGVIAILGHTLSVFIRFKGGKGVATSAGVLLFVAPKTLICLLILWFFIVLLTGYVSLASIVAALSSIIFLLAFDADWLIIIPVSIVAIFIVVKHFANIKRLWNGTESKVKWREKLFKK